MARKTKVSITLNIPRHALRNFKKIVESRGDLKVLDVVKLLEIELKHDIKCSLESYGYMIMDGDSLYEGIDEPVYQGVLVQTDDDDEGYLSVRGGE